MSLLRELTELVQSVFTAQGLDPSYGDVVVSQRPDLCQFQCNGALPLAKKAGKNPRELATALAAALNDDHRIALADVAGPGFLNISVEDDFLAEQSAQLTAGNHFGIEAKNQQVIVDYGGPNIAKSLHVGHLRPAVIGESVKRLYRFARYDAIGDVHLGDWGLPMGQLIAAIEDASPELPYFADGAATSEGPYPTESPVTIEDLEELYPQASARCKEDKAFAAKAQQATLALQKGHLGYRALWNHFRTLSVADMTAIYAELGVHFELWLGEASVADDMAPMIEKLVANQIAQESDGALIIDVADPKDKKELPPFMLQNSRGGYSYATSDLATIEQRVKGPAPHAIVYVTDARQSLHFQQLFRAADKAKMAPASTQLIHASHGMVTGKDNKPFKTRDGKLPRLGELVADAQKLAAAQIEENNLAEDLSETERASVIELVGLAALTYGELSNHRTTNYIFDLEKFTELKGQTGPYLQYVAVRIKSALQKAADAGLHAGTLGAATCDEERNVQLELTKLPEIVERAVAGNAPNIIAEYSYVLAATFNRFYDKCHILSEPNAETQQSWLALLETTQSIFTAILDILLIQVPEKM